MSKNDIKTSEIVWMKTVPADSIAHMLPVRNQGAAKVFLFILGVMLIPIFIGIPLIFLAFAKGKKFKDVRVGDCPVCETPLGFQKSVTSFSCPECKCRSVIKKDHIRSI